MYSSTFNKLLITLAILLCLQMQAWAAAPTVHGHTNNSNAGSSTINVPTNTNGDLLVWAVCTNNTTPTTPSGWNQYAINHGAAGVGDYIYTRVASSEPASYTISGALVPGMVMISISGSNASLTLDANAFNSNSGTTTTNTPALAGLTTSSDLLLGVYNYSSGSGATTLTESGNLTKVDEAPFAFGVNFGCWVGSLALAANSAATQSASTTQAGAFTNAALAIVPASVPQANQGIVIVQ